MAKKPPVSSAIVGVARPDNPDAKGLGFVVSGGFVITAAHNLAPPESPNGLYDYDELLVAFGGNEQHSMTPVFVDQCSDLAVLAPADEDGSLAERLAGISPLAIAWSPLMVKKSAGGVFTHDKGLIPASYTVDLGHQVSFLTDAPINAGTSGGPVCDCTGAVLAVVSQTSSHREHRDGWGPLLGHCLPKWLIRDIEARERMEHGMPHSARPIPLAKEET